MSVFTLTISCLTTSNLPWFMGPTFQVPVQYCSLQHRTLLPSPVTSTTGCCFCFGSISSFFLELFLHWSPVAYWAPTDLGSSLQQYMNHELPDIQAGFRKGRGTRDQTANIRWIIEKAREFQKNISFCVIDYAKPFDCVDHNKLWKILKEMGIPDHLTCLLRNLYAGQESTVSTGTGT